MLELLEKAKYVLLTSTMHLKNFHSLHATPGSSRIYKNVGEGGEDGLNYYHTIFIKSFLQTNIDSLNRSIALTAMARIISQS